MSAVVIGRGVNHLPSMASTTLASISSSYNDHNILSLRSGRLRRFTK